MSILRSSYLVVRPTGAPINLPDGGSITGHPDVPAGWEVTLHSGWYRIVTLSGVQLFALRLNTVQQDTTKGLWLVIQQEPDGTDELAALAAAPSNDYAEPAKGVWLDAVAGGGVARAALRHWPDWVVSGTLMTESGLRTVTDEVFRLVARDSGDRVPADWFTGSGPWSFGNLTVTSFARPALTQTIAGYDHDASVEGL